MPTYIPAKARELAKQMVKLDCKADDIIETVLRIYKHKLGVNTIVDLRKELRDENGISVPDENNQDLDHVGISSKLPNEFEEEEEEESEKDLLDPVDISSKLPNGFEEQLDSKESQERKNALDLLNKLLSENPRLADSQECAQVIQRLVKLLNFDADVNVATAAAKCLTDFAKGLRGGFTPYAQNLATVIFDKFKEKKATLWDALIECINAVFDSTNLTTLSGCILKALPKANLNQKSQLDQFIYRVFCALPAKDIPKDFLEDLIANLIEHSSDPDPEVQDSSCAALGAIMKCIGEKAMTAFLNLCSDSDITGDSTKMSKISEYRDKAFAEAPPSKTDRQVLPKDALLKNVQKPFGEEILCTILDTTGIKLEHIEGNFKAKEALDRAIILPAENPTLCQGLLSPPKGILLFGPPGNGKTFLAKAVANLSNSTFFNISAATIMSKWVGNAERLVQALFQVARNAQPSIIFIDEIDSMLRGIKTEFLVQLDGCSGSSDERVLVLGATNRPFDLDEGVLRRFPVRIFIDLPDQAERAQMIRRTFEMNNTRTTFGEQEINAIASRATNFSYCDLRNMCADAAYVRATEIPFEILAYSTIEVLRDVNMADMEKALGQTKPITTVESRLRLENFALEFGQSQENGKSDFCRHFIKNLRVVNLLPCDQEVVDYVIRECTADAMRALSLDSPVNIKQFREILAKFTQLEHLRLSLNDFETEDLKALVAFPNLQALLLTREVVGKQNSASEDQKIREIFGDLVAKGRLEDFYVNLATFPTEFVARLIVQCPNIHTIRCKFADFSVDLLLQALRQRIEKVGLKNVPPIELIMSKYDKPFPSEQQRAELKELGLLILENWRS